jgi:hypothetical protein
MHAKMKLVYRRWNLEERSGNNWTLERPIHRVDRVLGFFSSRSNWDSPSPHPQASAPCLWFRGEGHNRLWESEWGPNSDEGTDTVVLFICIYSMYLVDPFIFLVWLSLVGTEKDTIKSYCIRNDHFLKIVFKKRYTTYNLLITHTQALIKKSESLSTSYSAFLSLTWNANNRDAKNNSKGGAGSGLHCSILETSATVSSPATVGAFC